MTQLVDQTATATHADGTAYLIAQFYCEPGGCPDKCPKGCEPVEYTVTEEPSLEYAEWQSKQARAVNLGLPFDASPPPETIQVTTEEHKWITPEGAVWPCCLTCGANMNAAIESPGRTPDVVKDAVWIPADYTPKELAALILAKAETRRATAKRLAIKDGLIPLDATHAVQVLDRSTVELATGLSVEAVTVVILEAGFPGYTPEPVRATVLVPTDKPLAAAIKKALAK